MNNNRDTGFMVVQALPQTRNDGVLIVVEQSSKRQESSWKVLGHVTEPFDITKWHCKIRPRRMK
jgi:hypothetical protein